MDRDFWLNRWQANQIGFHLGEVNPRLVAHQQVLPHAPATRILVPLCGKSLDLAWLAQRGYEVVGVELSELAVRAFFDERGIAPAVEARAGWTVFRAPGLTIYCGDFLALGPAQLGHLEAFYDRAALVALPPALRQRYAAHLAGLFPAGAVGLLVCFEYAQHEMEGPPFAVLEAEVRALYEPAFRVEPLARYDILADEARFRERGLTSLHERTYRLVRL